MNTTVAIVGTHPTTRGNAPFENLNIDIWAFNNQALQPWCPRVDAILDMHPADDIWRRAKEQLAFGQWLDAEKKAVLYTPTLLEPAVPNNVVYPIQEVTDDLLKNIKRGGQINQYFTSGPAYAIALAIYKGYKRIELYGVEMESNAEYVYQRDGVSLFLGIAASRGIEVVLPPETVFLLAPLYGYHSDSTKVDWEAFETQAQEILQALENTKGMYDLQKGRLDSVVRRIAEMNARGATREEMKDIGEEYEKVQNDYEQSIADHAFVNGQYVNCRAWQARVEKAMQYSGHSQEMLGITAGKWQRTGDRIDLAHKWGDTPLPGTQPVEQQQ